MKFATTVRLKNLCSALLLAAGAANLVGCDATTTEPASGTGGNTVALGGSNSSGGQVPATGGATSATGGATSATGGAMPATGGAIPATGGATSATGGAVPPATGGASNGGATGTGGGTGGLSTGTGGGTVRADGGMGGMMGSGGTTGKNDASAAGGTGGIADGSAGKGGSTPLPDGAPVDPSKKITIWMVGDSTMQNCSGTGQCGWASEFQQYVGPNATVSNQARGGRSIQTWIWGDPNVSKNTPAVAGGECTVIDNTTYSDNLTTMLDPVKGMQPGDWVYVAFGINDATATCNRHVGKALFQSDLDFMAKTIRSKGANPIFGTSTSGQSCSGSTNVPNRGFGPETMAAGTADSVPVVDLTTLSVALYNSLKLCPGGSTTFWFDGTHFKTDGATQVAGVVAKAIKDQGIGLAAYLK
jgi:lysophospholipase L1-like esterase